MQHGHKGGPGPFSEEFIHSILRKNNAGVGIDLLQQPRVVRLTLAAETAI